MLVLSRKISEAIVVNDTVRITVLGIKGDRVRLGIEAPMDVPVDRAEVHARRMEFVVDVPFAAASTVCDETVDLGGELVATAYATRS
jgi:carbon storage regulator